MLPLRTMNQRLSIAIALSLCLMLPAVCVSCMHEPQVSLERPYKEQYNAMVMFMVSCPGGGVHGGSGVIVGPHHILTAEHVIECNVPSINLGADGTLSTDNNKVPPLSIKINAGEGFKVAEVDVRLPQADIARVTTKADLSKWFTPIRIGSYPGFGTQVCESAALPRSTFRCGLAQEGYADADGDIGIEMFTEYGNSGSGLYDDSGALVGIVVMLTRCQSDHPCQGRASSLYKYPWLIP